MTLVGPLSHLRWKIAGTDGVRGAQDGSALFLYGALKTVSGEASQTVICEQSLPALSEVAR